jgi:hypothetical protein
VTTTAIRTDGLSKRYGNVEVLKDLALEVSTRCTSPRGCERRNRAPIAELDR